MLPNFLIVGAARCGTSTLYGYLKQHPEIYLPQNKRPEPHFFFKYSEYAKGIEYYESRYFDGWRGERAVGEASTSYIFGAETPARVHRWLPDIRLIVMFRNPIDRTYSSYWHSVKAGIEDLPFDEAIEREDERTKAIRGTRLDEIKPYSYVGRSLYHAQLTRWLEYFDRSRFHVILFDDFVGQTRSEVVETLSYLDVDPSLVPENFDLIENRTTPEGRDMSETMRRRLATIFEPDVRALGELLGRNLDNWLV